MANYANRKRINVKILYMTIGCACSHSFFRVKSGARAADSFSKDGRREGRYTVGHASQMKIRFTSACFRLRSLKPSMGKRMPVEAGVILPCSLCRQVQRRQRPPDRGGWR